MQRALLFAIRIYQWLLSPLLPPACRYVPSCSQFAAEAVEFHGPWKGALLALWRLLRCHPFARGGFDPVPMDHVAHVPGSPHRADFARGGVDVHSRVRTDN
jgi:hypothetical protein